MNDINKVVVQLYYFCRYFYVVVWKLTNGKEPALSGSYKNNELVTYAEHENSSNRQPYIAAAITFSDFDENVFILGDGSNTHEPASQRRRFTTSDYYNGPLDPTTSHRIFLRIFLNYKVGKFFRAVPSEMRGGGEGGRAQQEKLRSGFSALNMVPIYITSIRGQCR